MNKRNILNLLSFCGVEWVEIIVFRKEVFVWKVHLLKVPQFRNIMISYLIHAY